MFPSADATGTFDLDFSFAGIHHGLHDFDGGALHFAAGVEARRGFYEVRARCDGAFCSVDYLLFVQGIGFDYHFEQRAVLVANFRNGFYIRRHIVKVAASQLTVVGNDVKILNLVVAAIFLRLFYLAFRGR